MDLQGCYTLPRVTISLSTNAGLSEDSLSFYKIFQCLVSKNLIPPTVNNNNLQGYYQTIIINI